MLRGEICTAHGTINPQRDKETRALVLVLEELHRTLVLLGFFHRAEGAQVSSLAGFRIDLARVEAVLAGFEFADHDVLQKSRGARLLAPRPGFTVAGPPRSRSATPSPVGPRRRRS